VAAPRPTDGRRDSLGPSLAIVLSTLFWGTLWIPLRGLDHAGLSSAWATAGGFALPLAILLPVGLARRWQLRAAGRPLFLAGLLTAAAIALYAEGLLRGYVARVILLFYLTPVWSTLLARWRLGVPITAARSATIGFGLLGLFVVLGNGGAPVPHTVADWMGLLSGICWAWAMVSLQHVEQVADVDKMFVQFLFLAPLFVLFTIVPGGRSWVAPSVATLSRSLGWLLALGLLWMPAVVGLTIFGGSRVEPGRVAVLLMLEIVVGLGSAAALAGEPLGARELLGAVMIVGSCGAEVVATVSGNGKADRLAAHGKEGTGGRQVRP